MTSIAIKIDMLKTIKIETLNTVFISAVVGLTIAYLFIVNGVIMTNYRKNISHKNIENLKIEIRTLNLELSGKRSIGFLQQAIQDLNLVPNDQVQYIKISGSVAKNQ